MTHAQDNTQAQAALLRNDSGIATPVKDCGCEAASIIAPLSSNTEGLVPHEKLREAATASASLIALDRPPAQPAKGYMHPPFFELTAKEQAVCSCIANAINATLAENASGVFATVDEMAIAIHYALLEADLLRPEHAHLAARQQEVTA